eukprot:Nitzschia sp. Nitz4//scaffold71_size96697//46430//47542//NITZ4_004695-RA/size96697-processed-gene-0.130-mRNA-1//-1//CDS//3329557247//3280//frame0
MWYVCFLEALRQNDGQTLFRATKPNTPDFDDRPLDDQSLRENWRSMLTSSSEKWEEASDVKLESALHAIRLVDKMLYSQQDKSVSARLVYCAALYCVMELKLAGPIPRAECTFGNHLAKNALVWALQRRKIPFAVEISAVETRQILTKITMKNMGLTLRSGWQRLLNNPKRFLPMIELLIDRLSASIARVTTMARDMELKQAIAAREKAARRVRETLVAESCCLVCLAETPNMATLCCGQPVHMNCLATWLRNHSTCPQCRSAFPKLNVEGFVKVFDDGTITSSEDDGDSTYYSESGPGDNVTAVSSEHRWRAVTHTPPELSSGRTTQTDLLPLPEDDFEDRQDSFTGPNQGIAVETVLSDDAEYHWEYD